MEIANRAVALAGGRVVSDVSDADRAPGGDTAELVDHDPAFGGDDAVVVAFRGGPNVA